MIIRNLRRRPMRRLADSRLGRAILMGDGLKASYWGR